MMVVLIEGSSCHIYIIIKTSHQVKLVHGKVITNSANYSFYLFGFMTPETFLRIVSFFLCPNLMPMAPNADSTMLRVVFVSVESPRSPTRQLASTVKFLNFTTTVGSVIPTLDNKMVYQVLVFIKQTEVTLVQ